MRAAWHARMYRISRQASCSPLVRSMPVSVCSRALGQRPDHSLVEGRAVQELVGSLAHSSVHKAGTAVALRSLRNMRCTIQICCRCLRATMASWRRCACRRWRSRRRTTSCTSTLRWAAQVCSGLRVHETYLYCLDLCPRLNDAFAAVLMLTVKHGLVQMCPCWQTSMGTCMHGSHVCRPVTGRIAGSFSLILCDHWPFEPS